MNELKNKKVSKALRVLALTLALTVSCGVFASCGNTHGKDSSKASETGSDSSSDNNAEASADDLLPTTDEDIPDNSFIITLRDDKAPITCENFEKLVSDGFYNGVTFHRVVSGFMAQGGDPEGTGAGGSKETIKGEFSSNGVDNDLKHLRSIVSMARSQDNDSASSQFFICYDDVDFLNGNYAAFGQVTQGMEVVDRFLNCDREMNENYELATPVKPITITKAEMIEPDANGYKRALFTMDFTEREFKEGEFVVTLNAEEAPITCENFEKLVSEGFYDGLTFHRVMEGFMAQGGDPEGMDVVDGFLTVSMGVNQAGSEISSPGTPITILKAEMIDPDESGNHRAKFTVRY